VEELSVGTPETATLSSPTMATITVAARRTIEGAVVVFAHGQRRDLQ
jgi:hypothetical protein